MISFKIDKEDLIGVWENKNIEPNSYYDNLEITLYLGANNTSCIRINKNKADKDYFSEGFDLIKSNKNSNNFRIIFKNSELNDGKDLILNCKVYSFDPLIFIIDFLQYGKRLVQKF